MKSITGKDSHRLVEWFKEHEEAIRQKRLNAGDVANMANKALGLDINENIVRNRISMSKRAWYQYKWPGSPSGGSTVKDDIRTIVQQIWLMQECDEAKLTNEMEELARRVGVIGGTA